MISSPEEFVRLRLSDDTAEQRMSVIEEAPIKVWIQVIEKYPEMKEWVVHNKSIQIQILELLAHDEDPKIRCVVARKRKINDKIFDLLKKDKDESVRHALICNTKLPIEKKLKIYVEDSDWLMNELKGKNI